jgi:hypothetical protein
VTHVTEPLGRISTIARLVGIVQITPKRRKGMQDERKDDVAPDEEVEGHHYRYGTEDAPARQDEESDEDEVEAHRFRTGPEEFGKRF